MSARRRSTLSPTQPAARQTIAGGGAPRTKRQRTRARLIEAAAEMIEEKGYDRTSLENVATRAGMTRGAIYGNFKNKEELFLAVAASRYRQIIPVVDPGVTSLDERMRILGQAVAAAAPGREAQAVGVTSFVLYALTHPEMQARIAAMNAQIYRSAAKTLTASVSEDKLPMPAEQFVRVIHALTDGLLMLRALTPDLIDDATIVAAFGAFGTAGSRVQGRGSMVERQGRLDPQPSTLDPV